MLPATDHTCKPNQFCARCSDNVRAGGGANHPSNLSGGRPPVKKSSRQPVSKPARQPLQMATCANLSAERVTFRGLSGTWQKCNAGYGSITPGERNGYCCNCPTKRPGGLVWRVGDECGPKCAGYASPAATASASPDPSPYILVPPNPYPVPGPLPQWQPVSAPNIQPELPRLVLTLVVGDDAEAMHAESGASQKAYADRIGADYRVMRGKTQDERMACGEKWRAKDYVPHYPGGTLYLDADVWVHDDAPDVFDVVPPGSIGLRDVILVQQNLTTWAPAEYAALCHSQGVPQHPDANRSYYNSGVWVGYPEHAGYWEPPERPYPDRHCTEEHWCRHNLAVAGWPVVDLGEAFNWLWYLDRECNTAHRCHFLHLAGMSQPTAEIKMGGKEWRLSMLRLLAASAAK